MILIVKAGTNLAQAGSIDMFIAADVPTAIAEWKAAIAYADYEIDPVPESVDVYTLTPFVDDLKVEQ